MKTDTQTPDIYDAGYTDAAVIGAGHAGCEAALALAQMGIRTIIFAINLDSIALMPCNPNIGGTSKGHLVREIDALGGCMGKTADKAAIQIRMLNMGKGPAVHSLRAQADKAAYQTEMKKTLENTPNLKIKQAEIVDIKPVDNKIILTTSLGASYQCKAAVICGGTYLNARCLYGNTALESGPSGFKNSSGLSEALKKLGINLMRFKTGTPARLDGRTVDYSKMVIQEGEDTPYTFSFDDPEKSIKNQTVCYLTHTTSATHKIIKDNIHLSPMYSGVAEGIGARYCPSIEDKVTRFADKTSHQIFIEPEGLNTNEMYVGGASTSLPENVQLEFLRTVPGLENCEITRPAYAIEYDCIDSKQLTLGLMFKHIPGLFSAGQLNGTSGYEEAAAQGLMAGINAANYILGKDEFVLRRDEGYIGVMIDDLVIKGTAEPYRMMTSRAEYRLLLRQDNADTRLSEKGYELGLISQARYRKLQKKVAFIEREIGRVKSVTVPPSPAVNTFLAKQGSAVIDTGIKLTELIKRPELDYACLAAVDLNRPALPAEVTYQVNIQIKYEGYIKRQLAQVERSVNMENCLLPDGFDYGGLQGLRLEARQKLTQIKPRSLGAASRIQGVTPADITVLMVHLKAGSL